VKVLPASVTRATSSDDAPSTGVTPPPELLAEASSRLGWAALIYVVCFSVAYFGAHLFAWLTIPNHVFWRMQHVFAVISIGLAAVVFVLSRRSTLSSQQLLDFGLVFEVVAALGISVTQFWHGFPTESFLDRKFEGVPWESSLPRRSA
jgi:hypothetical protein